MRRVWCVFRPCCCARRPQQSCKGCPPRLCCPQVEETLEVPVKAGWKEGTRITFTGEPPCPALACACLGCVRAGAQCAARHWHGTSSKRMHQQPPCMPHARSHPARPPSLSCVAPLPPPAGKGDELPGRPAQDLVFVVKQKPHPVFARDGDDLVATLRIPVRWGSASWVGQLGWVGWASRLWARSTGAAKPCVWACEGHLVRACAATGAHAGAAPAPRLAPPPAARRWAAAPWTCPRWTTECCGCRSRRWCGPGTSDWWPTKVGRGPGWPAGVMLRCQHVLLRRRVLAC